jgi:hypothetical protein
MILHARNIFTSCKYFHSTPKSYEEIQEKEPTNNTENNCLAEGCPVVKQ